MPLTITQSVTISDVARDSWHLWLKERTTEVTLTISALSDSATSCTMAGVAVGDSFLIDAEVITVTAIDGSTATLSRGQLGTTAASHSNGATAKKLQHGSIAAHIFKLVEDAAKSIIDQKYTAYQEAVQSANTMRETAKAGAVTQ
jgi:hypothetical protein